MGNITIGGRILHLLIAIDQLVWVVITLGAGFPDETISSAAWRHEQKGSWLGKIARPTIDLLFFWDPNHCQVSYLAEKYQQHLPYRVDRMEAFKEARKQIKA